MASSARMNEAGVATRLRRRREFLAVAATGQRAAAEGVVVQGRFRNDADPPRLGFTVTRKVGNAVIRNRVRRRLRAAAAAALRDGAGHGSDYVLVGRAGTLTRRFDALVADVTRAIGRLGQSVR